jgi:hypothetical protein
MRTAAMKSHQEIDDKWIEELIAMTEAEVFAYRTYLNVLSAQQTALLDRDVLRLSECSREAEKMIVQAKKASAARQEKLLALPVLVRSCQELVSLQQIIPLVRQNYAIRLDGLREELIDVLSKISLSNKTTLHLLQRSLNFVNKNIQILYQEIETKDAYDPQGKHQFPKRASTILKVA